MPKLAVIDFETTGLSAARDEVLQVSIIDENETVLMNEYCCPKRHTSWPDAQKVNGISPEMVAGKPPFEALVGQVQEILAGASQILAYNKAFERGFLAKYGIRFPDQKWAEDPFDTAAKYFDGTRKKLSALAAFFGYRYDAHNALEDVKATLSVYNKFHGEKELFRSIVSQAVPAEQDGLTYLTLPPDGLLCLLKLWALTPLTAQRPKALCYKGIYAGRPSVECEVIGFDIGAEKSGFYLPVVRAAGRVFRIHAQYLREMQTPSFERIVERAEGG